MKFEEAKAILVDTLDCDADLVTSEASVTEDLGADSLAIVELLMAFEEATGVSIPDEDVAELKTVGDFLKYLVEHGA